MLNHEIESEWMAGNEQRCPHCGKQNFTRVEENDGYASDGHWAEWVWECHECGKQWIVGYRLETHWVDDHDD